MQQPDDDDVTQEIAPWGSGEQREDEVGSSGVNLATVLMSVGVSAIVAAIIVTIGLVGILLLHNN